MADFGSETGNASILAMTKIMEAMMRLMEKIYQTWKEAPDRKLKSQQIKDLKAKTKVEKARKKLDGRAGQIRLNMLKKAKLPLRSFCIEVSPKDMRAFSELCRRENVLFSGIAHKGKENSDKREYQLICKQEDLCKIEEIVKRLNREKQLEALQERITEIKGKEELSDQDQIDIDYLSREKEKIQKDICKEMNQQTKSKVINKAISEDAVTGLTFDEALNRYTGRELDKDIYSIVADASDPNRMIRCHAYQDEFHGKPYIKTEYDIYVDGQKVYSCDDGKKENRPWDYWKNMKEEMKEAGNFSNTLIKFYDQKDYELWSEHVKLQREGGLQREGETEKIEDLQSQLHEKGYRYENGAIHAMTDDGISIYADNSIEHSESVVIAKQIQNLEQIQEVEEKLVNMKAEEILLGNEMNSTTDLLAKRQGLEKERIELQKLRKEMESIKVEVQQDIERERFELEQGMSGKDMTINTYQEEIQKVRKGKGHDQLGSKEKEKGKRQRGRE